jgi:hypothetical protein
MKKLAAKLTRSAIANTLGAVGALCLVTGAWEWNPVAGVAALGLGLLLAGWAVDE